MKKFICGILLIFSALLNASQSAAKPLSLTVDGEKASKIIDNFRYGRHFKPAYHVTHGVSCKSKLPQERDWGYAHCKVAGFYDIGSKTAFYFTSALIEALPEELRDQLKVSTEDADLGYTQSITLQELACDRAKDEKAVDRCRLVIDL